MGSCSLSRHAIVTCNVLINFSPFYLLYYWSSNNKGNISCLQGCVQTVEIVLNCYVQKFSISPLPSTGCDFIKMNKRPDPNKSILHSWNFFFNQYIFFIIMHSFDIKLVAMPHLALLCSITFDLYPHLDKDLWYLSISKPYK